MGFDMPDPDMPALVGFTQFVDCYDFTGSLGDRQRSRDEDWRGKSGSWRNKQCCAGDESEDRSHLMTPSGYDSLHSRKRGNPSFVCGQRSSLLHPC
jgi:hypothetical protein